MSGGDGDTPEGVQGAMVGDDLLGHIRVCGTQVDAFLNITDDGMDPAVRLKFTGHPVLPGFPPDTHAMVGVVMTADLAASLILALQSSLLSLGQEPPREN